MFDPVGICRVLNEAGVEFVVVGGLAEWDAHALTVEIADGVAVRVAELDDIIQSKRAANRPKDQAALPYLESLRDQLE